MLLYNVVAAVVLARAKVGLRLFGLGLWATVVLHALVPRQCEA